MIGEGWVMVGSHGAPFSYHVTELCDVGNQLIVILDFAFFLCLDDIV